MTRLLFLLFFMFPSLVFSQRELFTNSFVSIDNENQINIRNHQGISTDLDSLFKKDSIFIKRKSFVGISNGVRFYQTNIGEPTYFFNEAKIYFKTTPLKGFTTVFNPSILISKNFTTMAYEFVSTYKFSKFYVEVSSERDLVGARALGVNLVSNYYGLSIDYNPFKNLTLVGGYQYNHITDNNNRNFYLTRIIYTLPNEKIYFDFRTKDMRGGVWSEYYFSPEKISQKQIGVGLNQTLNNDNMILGGYIGGGIQKIDTQTMYLFSADLKLKTRISKKIQGESNLGIRNFNKYIYGFADLKLKYTF